VILNDALFALDVKRHDDVRRKVSSGERIVIVVVTLIEEKLRADN
jgi:hypothetical protein